MSLRVEDLSFSYGTRPVLQNISFSAKPGEFISVLGPNGVGKSTLFRCMLGLLPPGSGCTLINDRDIAGMTAAELAQQMAYIPQSHNPVFNYTVFDMVLMGTSAQLGHFSAPGKKQLRIAQSALERLEIAHLRDRGYGNISGGERQLVLIARAIAQQARLLVMDEPSANLDFGNRMRVMQTVKHLTEDGYTILQSTHDPDQAYLYSDKILALYDGKILAWGTPQQTVTTALISRLYGTNVEVNSMRDDTIRVCVPAEIKHLKHKNDKENAL